MLSHIQIIERILNEGEKKVPTRRNPVTGDVEPVDGGVSTISVPNVFWEHNMEEGFPLPTYRKLGLKQVAGELYCFMHGKRSKKEFQAAGCHYWDEWCNPQKIPTHIERHKYGRLMHGEYKELDALYSDTEIEELSWEGKKEYMKKEDDLGVGYGVQWRDFHGYYGGQYQHDSVVDGTDQLANIVKTLHESPHDRRMVCSCWNPNHFPYMALMPCHYAFMVNVTGDKLYLSYQMRSVDALRGPNTALYGLLLLLLAKEGDFKPGKLSAVFGDCHLYDRDIEVAREIVSRKDKCPALPSLDIPDESWSNIFEWQPTDYRLENYNPLPAIKMPKVVV